jgi:hypothetical protein
MKFTEKYVLTALITVTLIASGCTTGGGGGGDDDTEVGTNPIQVTEFTAFPNPAPSGNTVTFTLELSNNGEVTAENVVGKLWNPPFGSGPRVWSDSGGGAVSVPDRSFSFGDLRGQEEGVETFASPETLRLTAPSLDSGQSFPYNFHAKYYYKYATEGSTTITVMGNEQYRDSGSEKSRAVQISHNGAPISLEGQLLSGNPVVFYEDDGPSKEVQFCVVVNNVGGGTVFKAPEEAYQGEDSEEYVLQDGDTDHRNEISLTVESLGSTTVSTEEDGSGSSSASTTPELIGGDQVRECFFLEAQSVSSTGQTEIGPINIKAEYGYVEDTSTQVTVNGR